MTEQEKQVAAIKQDLRDAFERALRDVQKVTGLPVRNVTINFAVGETIGGSPIVMVDKIDFEFRL